ncbi:hypothetical protein EKM05_02070 [Flavobacterium sp. GSP27]|uniref:hypothetical protein n=1 Tax=unclassified Flavobacterium TaxID=196869 RepID=UPI000F827430|nr:MULTISPECIES: hypothetical protein [unclassified Flavobacterium]RTY84636.1 hypothetical protein EKL99_01170 [Flavobacterium sp. ZB4P23]RTY91992.1 hypothetical protein EKM01_05050 [Flavobacterium sp. RSP46]RTY96489.1 hypothetical protein EKL32_00010 [Flavobacterium sp. GSN2]RTZ10705.1 hypothetical protein EKM05_02070 [Flavobacterium sp. GSP27]
MNNKYTKALAILLFAAAGITTASAQVSQKIGANPFALTKSAALEIESTTKGFLPPRMTPAQRDLIATPATGLTIYNITDNLLQVNTGTTALPVWSAATVTATTLLAKVLDYTVLGTDATVLFDVSAASAGLTVTLPDVLANKGKIFTIIKIDASENKLKFVPALVFNIEYPAVSELNYAKAVRIQSDGSKWNVIN